MTWVIYFAHHTMKSGILTFLVLVSTFAVASSRAAEPTLNINSDASIQAEDSPRQIIDAEEIGHWYDEDVVDLAKPAVPLKANAKPTKSAALEEDQAEPTPIAQLHDLDHDHDHANDDEISGELKDTIGGEEFELDEDLVGKFWPDEDWDMYEWDNMHDEL